MCFSVAEAEIKSMCRRPAWLSQVRKATFIHRNQAAHKPFFKWFSMTQLLWYIYPPSLTVPFVFHKSAVWQNLLVVLPESVCVFGMESVGNLRSVQRDCAKKQRQKVQEISGGYWQRNKTDWMYKLEVFNKWERNQMLKLPFWFF